MLAKLGDTFSNTLKNTNTLLLENICVTPTIRRTKITILKKCREKLKSLIYEILFIQEKKPELNTQSDSIKAKLFGTWLLPSTFHFLVLLITWNEIIAGNWAKTATVFLTCFDTTAFMQNLVVKWQPYHVFAAKRRLFARARCCPMRKSRARSRPRPRI